MVFATIEESLRSKMGHFSAMVGIFDGFFEQKFGNIVSISYLCSVQPCSTVKKYGSRTMISADEQLIVEQLRLGNDRAYKYLYDRHYEALCRVAFRYVEDAFVAETLVEDLIVHLWEHRESLEVKISLRSYLLAAIRNRCLDYLESSSREHEIAASQISDTELQQVHTLLADPSLPLEEEQLVSIVQKAIDALPDECRRVFVESRLEEKSYQEIADGLGISINTVKYHIKNALRQLRETLGPQLMLIALLMLRH